MKIISYYTGIAKIKASWDEIGPIEGIPYKEIASIFQRSEGDFFINRAHHDFVDAAAIAITPRAMQAMNT